MLSFQLLRLHDYFYKEAKHSDVSESVGDGHNLIIEKMSFLKLFVYGNNGLDNFFRGVNLLPNYLCLYLEQKNIRMTTGRTLTAHYLAREKSHFGNKTSYNVYLLLTIVNYLVYGCNDLLRHFREIYV